MTLTESIDNNRTYLIGIFCLMVAAYYNVAPDMVAQWYSDDNYSHAFFVPLIAGYFLYERRDQLRNMVVAPWNPGLLIIIFALVQLIFGRMATEYFTMRSSIVVLIAGIVLFLFGRAVFRRMLLPIGYLFLMVPLPYIIYDAVAFPLKLFVTMASVGFLNVIGITVLRDGNILLFPSITLEVADACSGMRSLASLVALSVAYAFFERTTPARRVVIIFSAIPIAIFTNAMRVIITGILAQRWGAKAAEGFFHEFAGLAVFVTAIVMMMLVGVLVTRKEQR